MQNLLDNNDQYTLVKGKDLGYSDEDFYVTYNEGMYAVLNMRNQVLESESYSDVLKKGIELLELLKH